MSDAAIPLTDLLVPNGESESNILYAKGLYDDALSISIMSPNGLDAHTWQIHVTYEEENATVFFKLQEGNPLLDVSVPAENCARTYYDLTGYAGFKIVDESGTVTQDTTFKLMKKVRVD